MGREKKFPCTWEGCSKAFTGQWNLTRHLRVHNGEKPFVCNFEDCAFACSNKDSLERHSRLHTGEKKFVCNFEGCDYASVNKYTLIRHIRVHTGEKPFVCKVCNYASADKSHLTRHMCSHTGERTYSCLHEGCGAAFFRGDALRKHERCVHTDTGLKHQKVREEQVAQALTDAGVVYNREVKVRFSTPGRTSCARIDFVIPRDFGAVYLEIDECAHRHNTIADEADRMLRIFTELMIEGDARKIHMIRFNPDAYMNAGKRPKTPLAARLAELLQTLQCEPVKQHSITYMFYTKKDCLLPAICLDSDYPGSLRALVNS